LNVYEIQSTPIKTYLESFANTCKYVQDDLLNEIQDTDLGHLKFVFFQIMSTKGSALLKQVTNQIGTTFTLAQIKDADKYDY